MDNDVTILHYQFNFFVSGFFGGVFFANGGISSYHRCCPMWVIASDGDVHLNPGAESSR
jgi:hypothetical protein